MAYKGKISGRIEKYPCDVIINSLGVETTDYGLICKSILDASNDKVELEGIIQRANDVYDVGEYFFTDSYGLPTKAICHLITPNRDNDDDNLDVFIHSIKNVLMSCRELDYKTIGIPLVGTGANKYDPNIIYSLLAKICSSFCEYFPAMSVAIITPDDATIFENDERLMKELNNRGGDYHSLEVKKKFKKSTKYFKDYYQYDEGVIKFDKAFFDKLPIDFGSRSGKMSRNDIKKIPTYISRFIKAKYIGNAEAKARKNVYAYLGYGKKNPLSSGANTYKKIGNSADRDTCFKLCLAAKMNEGEALSFLNYFGLTFSYPGVNKTDDAFRVLLRKCVYDMVEVNKALIEAGEKPLFK